MIDIKLDEESLKKRLLNRASKRTSDSLNESDLISFVGNEEIITDEGIASVFQIAIEYAITTRALLEIINAQVTDENEAIIDRIVEEVTNEVVTLNAATHDKIAASCETPKVQA